MKMLRKMMVVSPMMDLKPFIFTAKGAPTACQFPYLIGDNFPVSSFKKALVIWTLLAKKLRENFTAVPILHVSDNRTH